MLLIALLAFPTGRLGGVAAWIAVWPAAVAVGLPLLPQPLSRRCLPSSPRSGCSRIAGTASRAGIRRLLVAEPSQ
jgi:hypothetical protein